MISESTFPDKLLLTETEAAKALTMSPRKLWTLRNRGEIAFIKTGRLVRYDPEDLRAWIEWNKTIPEPSIN